MMMIMRSNNVNKTSRTGIGAEPIVNLSSCSETHCRSTAGLTSCLQFCCAIVLLISLQPVQGAGANSLDYIEKYFKNLYKSDTCGAIYTSKRHGYDLEEHRVVTQDKYVLTLHRLIHPSDFSKTNQIKCNKKPYLLLHGLIGTSAGFVINVEDDYEAPLGTYPGVGKLIKLALGDKSYHRKWISTADNFGKRFELDQNKMASVNSLKLPTDFGRLIESIDFDADQTNFAREYKQANRKFLLPKDSKKFISNSLAMTMSNFGYDVWLLNLRGNSYSNQHAGPERLDTAEYWDFSIETLVEEDLRSSVDYVHKLVGCDDHPMGFVAHSYSNAHLLGLLAKEQRQMASKKSQQMRLQPIIMLAPTMLTPAPGREKLRLFMKGAQKLIISHNGPFPSLMGDKQHQHTSGKSHSLVKSMSLRAGICKLPIASKLCHLFELILHGQSDQVTSIARLISTSQSERETWRQRLIEQDSRCGRTSKRVVRQIIDNLVATKGKIMFDPSKDHGSSRRRSVILIHSHNDEVSSPDEVERIRDGPLRNLALVDYMIKDRHFGHTDFLYARENQYLVNAEALRFALLYDHLMYEPWANKNQHDTAHATLKAH